MRVLTDELAFTEGAPTHYHRRLKVFHLSVGVDGKGVSRWDLSTYLVSTQSD